MPFLSILGRFSAFLVGHRGFDSKLHFLSEPPRPIAELQSYVGVFEKSSVGHRFGAVSAVIWGKTGQKVGNGDKKKGAKNLPLQNFITFSRLTI